MRTVMLSALLGLVMASLPARAALNTSDMQEWTIVVDAAAIPSERFAAEEFQSLFKACTGIELSLSEDAPSPKHHVYIGASPAMLAAPGGFDVDAFGEEGFRIKVRKGNIIIAGGQPRGTLYGVYEFFERYFGVRFLTWDHVHIPQGGQDLNLKRDTYSYEPPFSFRWSYYRENALHSEFAARLRVNTVADDERLGGKTRQNLINHSLHRWINPAKYGQDHPEYFALVHGERELDVGGGGPEPCVTNPDVLDIVAKGVLDQLQANPNLENISVSQNDNDAYCRCPECEAVNTREGTPMGAQLALVNGVADAVAKEHPGVKVGTLAYWYTRKAPATIKPRDNVQIQLRSIECCTLHAIDDPKCPRNREFCQDMRDWKRICDDIWVWNYNTNFHCYDLPFPNLRSIGRNVRFFLNNNVKGLFMQANGNGTAGEMADLRNYVIARCMWHPGQDSWPLVEEFCRLHYEDSSEPILAYLTMLHDNAEARGVHPGCFPSAEQVGLTPEVAREALAFFEDALDRAPTDAVRQRVEKASICAYKAILLAGVERWVYEDGFCRRDLPQQYAGVPERYIELCKKYGMSMSSERTPAEAYFKEIENLAHIPAVAIENDVWRLTILPGENGKLVEMRHKPTGRDLLAAMTHSEILRGTHEEIGLKGYDEAAPKAFDARADGRRIVLTKKLDDGAVFEKTLELKEEEPSSIFFTAKLTHGGDAPKTYQFKAHPEFNAASESDDFEVVSAYIKDQVWKRFNKGWDKEKGPERDVLHQAAGGAFAFFNHEAGFGAMVRYPAEQVDYPYLWWYPPMRQINLELFTPARELSKGESLSLQYTFEFIDKPPV